MRKVQRQRGTNGKRRDAGSTLYSEENKQTQFTSTQHNGRQLKTHIKGPRNTILPHKPALALPHPILFMRELHHSPFHKVILSCCMRLSLHLFPPDVVTDHYFNQIVFVQFTHFCYMRRKPRYFPPMPCKNEMLAFVDPHRLFHRSQHLFVQVCTIHLGPLSRKSAFI